MTLRYCQGVDISFIAERLWIASKFYPNDDLPPNPIILGLSKVFEDSDLTPAAEDTALNYCLATQILRQQGYNVVLQCKAGRNRSGLIAALCLIQDGLSPQDAIYQVRAARTSLAKSGGALTNESFCAFILSSERGRDTT